MPFLPKNLVGHRTFEGEFEVLPFLNDLLVVSEKVFDLPHQKLNLFFGPHILVKQVALVELPHFSLQFSHKELAILLQSTFGSAGMFQQVDNRSRHPFSGPYALFLLLLFYLWFKIDFGLFLLFFGADGFRFSNKIANVELIFFGRPQHLHQQTLFIKHQNGVLKRGGIFLIHRVILFAFGFVD